MGLGQEGPVEVEGDHAILPPVVGGHDISGGWCGGGIVHGSDIVERGVGRGRGWIFGDKMGLSDYHLPIDTP